MKPHSLPEKVKAVALDEWSFSGWSVADCAIDPKRQQENAVRVRWQRKRRAKVAVLKSRKMNCTFHRYLRLPD